MSEKERFDTFKQFLTERDKKFFAKLDRASDVLEDPEQSLDYREQVIEGLKRMEPAERAREVNNYRSALDSDRYAESSKVIIKEVIDWADSYENEVFYGSQKPEAN